MLDHANGIRLGCFVAALTLTALGEALAPRRPRAFRRVSRWPSNLAVAALGSLALRLVLPAGAIGVALLAARHGWGVMHSGDWPEWVAVGVSIVALDLAIYLQHVLFHAVPALWRLHRMHHADLDFDVTTGARFHPLEIVLSMGFKVTIIAALGAPPEAVLAFEVLLNATSMFNHGNLRLPAEVDRVLRLLVVTPDMHRVHHSVVPQETNSNFGFNVPWWDRLLGTYRAQPAAGHADMTIGIAAFREARELRLGRMLTQPWRRAPDEQGLGFRAAE